MFDLTSGKLLILGIVALLVVGPKELPALLRTVGRYVGMIRRQAAEFRAQFDEAIRESELDQIRKDVESMRNDVETSMREAESSVGQELSGIGSELDTAAAATTKPAEPLSPAAAAAAAAADSAKTGA